MLLSEKLKCLFDISSKYIESNRPENYRLEDMIGIAQTIVMSIPIIITLFSLIFKELYNYSEITKLEFWHIDTSNLKKQNLSELILNVLSSIFYMVIFFIEIYLSRIDTDYKIICSVMLIIMVVTFFKKEILLKINLCKTFKINGFKSFILLIEVLGFAILITLPKEYKDYLPDLICSSIKFIFSYSIFYIIFYIINYEDKDLLKNKKEIDTYNFKDFFKDVNLYVVPMFILLLITVITTWDSLKKDGNKYVCIFIIIILIIILIIRLFKILFNIVRETEENRSVFKIISYKQDNSEQENRLVVYENEDYYVTYEYKNGIKKYLNKYYTNLIIYKDTQRIVNKNGIEFKEIDFLKLDNLYKNDEYKILERKSFWLDNKFDDKEFLDKQKRKIRK